MKKKLLFFFGIGFAGLMAAQNITFADPTFKSTLIAKKIDKDGDGEISIAEAQNVTYLDVSFKGITNFGGLENFTNLTTLILNGNKISSSTVDVSKNTKLITFACETMGISSIDVSNNPAIVSLSVMDNPITTVDTSKQPNLMIFGGGYSNIKSLDFSNNPKLANVGVSQAKLTKLDLSKNPSLMSVDIAFNPSLNSLNLANGNNASLTNVDARFNASLTCIQVDPGFTPPTYNPTTYSGWKKDDAASYSGTPCSSLAVAEVGSKDVFFYPNPATTYITFEAKAKINSVKIVDASGRVVANDKVEENRVNVEKLNPGVYYMVVEADGNTFKKSFIKK